MNDNFKAYLMLILCAFFWSGNFIVGKFATLYEVPPLTLNSGEVNIPQKN